MEIELSAGGTIHYHHRHHRFPLARLVNRVPCAPDPPTPRLRHTNKMLTAVLAYPTLISRGKIL